MDENSADASAVEVGAGDERESPVVGPTPAEAAEPNDELAEEESVTEATWKKLMKRLSMKH